MLRSILLVAFLFPAISHAEEIVVRSGDHENFTRLVFSLNRVSDWSIEVSKNDPSLVSLKILETKATFDLTEAFTRIGRDRVSTLQSLEPGVLEIELSCKCQTRSFLQGGELLVLDIFDDPNNHQEDNVEDNPKNQVGNLTSEDASLIKKLSDISLTRLRSEEEVIASSLLNNIAIELIKDSIDKTVTSSASANEIKDDVYLEIENAVQAGFLNGIQSDGLLSAGSDSDPASQEFTNSEISKTIMSQQLSHAINGAVSGNETNSNIVIELSSCRDDSDLNISTWVTSEEGAFEQLSRYRGEIFGEFDRINAKGIEKYVKSAIYFGYGAEAISVLDFGMNDDAKLLRALAHLVDFRDDPSDFFSTQLRCKNSSVVWAVLDMRNFDDLVVVDQKALLASLEGLPRSIRFDIGLRLVEIANESNMPGLAKDILGRLSRSLRGGEDEGIKAALVSTEIAAGDYQEAQNLINYNLLTSSSRHSDRIQAIVTVSSATNEPIPEAVIELAESFSFEHRGAETADKHWLTYINSLITSSQFFEAFEAIGSYEAGESKIIETALNSFFSHLLKHGEAGEVLKYIFLQMEGKGFEMLSEDNRRKIINNLMRFGSYREVLSVDLGEGSEALLARKKILEARSLIALGEAKEAEISVIGREDDDARLVRGQARQFIGDHGSAVKEFSTVGQSDEIAYSAWLGENWNFLENSENEVMREVALSRSNRVEASESDGLDFPLIEQMPQDSRAFRELMSKLLSETSFSVTSD